MSITKKPPRRKGIIIDVRVEKPESTDLLPYNTTKTQQRRQSGLASKTQAMLREQRRIEQEGARRFAKLHQREHSISSNVGSEEGQQNTLLENPFLLSQRFDGIDPSLLIDAQAKMELENALREQEMEKQNRLQNQKGMGMGKSKAPRPGGM